MKCTYWSVHACVRTLKKLRMIVSCSFVDWYPVFDEDQWQHHDVGVSHTLMGCTPGRVTSGIGVVLSHASELVCVCVCVCVCAYLCECVVRTHMSASVLSCANACMRTCVCTTDGPTADHEHTPAARAICHA